MKTARSLVSGLLLGGALLGAPAISAPVSAPVSWSAAGTLLESCTCAVPCTCNFGQGPSPKDTCNAVFAYRLEKASWDGIDLSGLVIAGADGPKGTAGFIDDRATAAQRPALEKLGAKLFAQGGPARIPKEWTPIALTHEVKGGVLHLAIGDKGGFTARILMGRDGKSPIVVENNLTWPIPRATKGISSTLSFQDDKAGSFSGEKTNANYGSFSFSAPR